VENAINLLAPIAPLLLVVSLKAGLAFFLVLLVRSAAAVLKQRRYVHLLWLIFFFRLCVPTDIESRISPFRFLPVDRLAAVPAEAATAGTAPSPAALPAPAPAGATDTVLAEEHRNGAAAAPLSALLALIWLTGAACFSAGLFINYKKHRKRLAGCEPVTDQTLLRVFERARRVTGAAARIRLLQTADRIVPYASGLWRPVVVVPRSLFSRLSPEQWECVFTHELLHITGKDLWLRALAGLLTVVHWFNPLVWIAGRLLRRDGEAACDAAALSALGAEKIRRYGNTILRIAELTQVKPFPQCALGIIGKQHHLSRRLILIRSFKRKNSRWQLAGVVFLFCVSLMLFTKATGADDGIPITTDRTMLFKAPLADPKVTMEFGWNVNPLTHRTFFHNGIDMAAPVGTKVTAAANGVIVKINETNGGDYGTYVVIRHPGGYTTGYTKLKSVSVTLNQSVTTGEEIGLSGLTGVGTGPHVHFMLLRDDTAINPREFILF
jgi:beta-lactamase regulating signal transducer with metallopeptidase domain